MAYSAGGSLGLRWSMGFEKNAHSSVGHVPLCSCMLLIQNVTG